MKAFSIARLPRIIFASGAIRQLPEIVSAYGRRILLVTGGQSLLNSVVWTDLTDNLRANQIEYLHCTVTGEPSPELVDDYVREFASRPIDAVVGIGGGSALDAAKAIAGLLKVGHSVMDYLEGVGPELPYEGPAVPLIAVPTTAGTGSEATKNAVLSRQSGQGFKKSFRDDQLVAEYALLDPDLLATCPVPVIAANGMDALTQLLESYVSNKANAFTDALAISGLRAARDALLPWYGGDNSSENREKMAYAALNSGITLAQVGLGSVHGLASPLGAYYPVPHGVVCGTLVAEATALNIRAMLVREPDNPALEKYARAAEILCQRRIRQPEQAWEAIVDVLTKWTEALALPRLSAYGVSSSDLDKIVANARGSSMKTNPIVLTDEEIGELVTKRL